MGLPHWTVPASTPAVTHTTSGGVHPVMHFSRPSTWLLVVTLMLAATELNAGDSPHRLAGSQSTSALDRVLISPGTLVAQGRVSHLRKRFREGDNSTNYIAYIWLITIPVMLAGGISAFYRIRFPDGPRSEAPSRLKRELYREHQLTGSQVRMLKSFADQSEVVDELVLLVRPELFDQAALQWLSAKGAAKIPQVDALRTRLFGDAVGPLDVTDIQPEADSEGVFGEELEENSIAR